MQTENEEVVQQRKKRPPAKTPEGRENQLIALAYDLVEKQLRDGTASSQIISQIIKEGSRRAKLERELLEQDKILKHAKTEAIESSKRVEELYKEAMEAMKKYSGNRSGDDDDD